MGIVDTSNKRKVVMSCGHINSGNFFNDAGISEALCSICNNNTVAPFFKYTLDELEAAVLVSGRWIINDGRGPSTHYYCASCGYDEENGHSNFCPLEIVGRSVEKVWCRDRFSVGIWKDREVS